MKGVQEVVGVCLDYYRNIRERETHKSHLVPHERSLLLRPPCRLETYQNATFINLFNRKCSHFKHTYKKDAKQSFTTIS
jgi:hypothetical protein